MAAGRGSSKRTCENEGRGGGRGPPRCNVSLFMMPGAPRDVASVARHIWQEHFPYDTLPRCGHALPVLPCPTKERVRAPARRRRRRPPKRTLSLSLPPSRGDGRGPVKNTAVLPRSVGSRGRARGEAADCLHAAAGPGLPTAPTPCGKTFALLFSSRSRRRERQERAASSRERKREERERER